MDDSRLQIVGKRFSPWQRGRDVETTRPWSYMKHDFDEPFDLIIDKNIDLSTSVKRITIKVCKSVVSIETRLGDQQVFCGSGTIIECIDVDTHFTLTILTSGSVVHQPNTTGGDFKILVRISGGEVLPSRLVEYEAHYNVAIIEAISQRRLPAATIKRLHESIPPFRKKSGEALLHQHHPHSSLFKISPGDELVALGRFQLMDCQIMAAPGKFSIDTSLKFDCKELCDSTCRITKCGIGGPVVNYYGEVIGISFYDRRRTPFLPTNVAISWWEYFKENKRSNRPWLGLEVVRLTLGDFDVARQIFQHHPHVADGVVVTKVMPLSPAQQVGISLGDVITKSGDDVISSSLKLFEEIFNKVGTTVDLAIIRATDPLSTSHVKIKVDGIIEEKINR